VLLIDRSYSMHGKRLEYAKTAALSALDRLEEHHRLAVVAFDSQQHDVVPLSAVGNKRHAEDLISEISAGGETNIFNVLWHARKLLHDSTAATRHVVLISDGDTAPPHDEDSENAKARAEIEKLYGVSGVKARAQAKAAEIERAAMPKTFEEMAHLFAQDHITLSTVAIGDKPKLQFLADLAKWTAGQAYVASGDADIPTLLVKDTSRMLGDSFVEEPFRPAVLHPAAAIDGIDFAHGPELKGFVIARAKPAAEVVLQARDDHPLLVRSHHGLGRTVTFTSDLKNRWSVDWLGWPGYARFWAQIVRDSIRRDSGETLAFTVERERHAALVQLIARTPEGEHRNGLAPKVRALSPDGTAEVVPLDQTAPGVYRGRVPLTVSRDRAWRFELVATDGIGVEEIARTGLRSLHFDRVDEDRGLPADTTLLSALCTASGGQLAPRIGDIFAERGDGGSVSIPLWPMFSALALLAYLLDILVRRMGALPFLRRTR